MIARIFILSATQNSNFGRISAGDGAPENFMTIHDAFGGRNFTFLHIMGFLASAEKEALSLVFYL
jgi:hypothetical protein